MSGPKENTPLKESTDQHKGGGQETAGSVAQKHELELVDQVEEGCTCARFGLLVVSGLWIVSFAISMTALGLRAKFNERLCSIPSSGCSCAAPHSWGFELAEDLLYYISVLCFLVVVNCVAWTMLKTKKFVVWYFLFTVFFGLSDACDDAQELYESVLLMNQTFVGSEALSDQLSVLINVSAAAVAFDLVFIIGIIALTVSLCLQEKLSAAVLS